MSAAGTVTPTPVEAVRLADPYPFYARLVAERPFAFDEALGAWVAADAAAVRAVLGAGALRVRPVAEPVPAGIAGTPAGEVFGELVRMTDGAAAARLKGVVAQALARADLGRAGALAARYTREALARGGDVPCEELMFGIPARVVATLSGLTEGADREAAAAIGDFVRCIPATATSADHRAAARAAVRLRELLGPPLTSAPAASAQDTACGPGPAGAAPDASPASGPTVPPGPTGGREAGACGPADGSAPAPLRDSRPGTGGGTPGSGASASDAAPAARPAAGRQGAAGTAAGLRAATGGGAPGVCPGVHRGSVAGAPYAAGRANGLLRELVGAAERAGCTDPGPLLSNAIGFLSQTYDATAGLIGNTLVALARGADAPDTGALVREVVRYDAPVQNTRRFAAEPFTHAGSTVEPGQQVLVVLAAANRDPAVNPDPHALSPGRVNPAVFTFGAGAHRCPGGELATALATAVVGELRRAGWSTTTTPAYRPLANARIPLL
ncbi:cytochrome P450 [Streptomyces racemochromogenes]|uniref:Cytochrome P450 n=1 Tax=Streptomyces racemochromogenes TaxID=67353 RepID=A0ABW7PDM6_9ACTN